MNDIAKAFAGKSVLSSVTYEVHKQEIFGLLGPSGAGKTTIINILTHQLNADGGSYNVGAAPLETGLMLDEDGLYTNLNCLENLNIFAGIYGISYAKTLQTLQSVGLEEAAKKAVHTLSKGMRQRLALARAILHEPQILYLDEPTSGLDPGTARSIHKLIQNLCKNGATIFLTTHNMEEAANLCDNVALLYKGRIVEQGAPYEICKRHNAIKTVPDLESVFIKLTGVGLE